MLMNYRENVIGNVGEPHPSASFLAGGGEMGALLRSYDWAVSSLGAPEGWPQSLKTALRIMLTSRQPIWIGWGGELTFFYNDAYKAIIGGKHPVALGRPTSEVWREIWADIGPLLATAMGGVEGTFVEEQLLIMERNGYQEETYYTFSYSPIPNDHGGAGGIICANADDTKRVIGERQLGLLRDLAAATGDTRNPEDVYARAASALATNLHDLPFVLLYMAEPDGQSLSLAAATGIKFPHAAAPEMVAPGSRHPWPFAEVLERREVVLVGNLAANFGRTLPTGAWHESPSQAALLPLLPAGESGRRGILIVGLNPFRLFDGNYHDFLGLVAGQIAAAVANADAYEQERRRAESLADIDRAKTAFFSNVSHEFRTPLTLMLGPLEESLADAQSLSPAERERVRVVHRNGMRLLRLVNSLLDFSRIAAGRMSANFEPTDLGTLTADLASNFRSATQQAGLSLDIDCPCTTQAVFVDRDMWEKIVFNLLSNAFKFTFQGVIRVALSYGDAAVTLQVQDTGTGIPAAELPRLFERFHRVEGARGRSFEGSGIGLALVKELVEAHRGSIQVSSEEGRGTTFRLTLPLGFAHLPPDEVRHGRDLTPTTAHSKAYVEEVLRWLPSSGSASAASETTFIGAVSPRSMTEIRSRVVLAEDNVDMRDYISRLLNGKHECVPTEDGFAALEEVRRRRPDLVLTDIMMPRLDGFGLIRAIRDDLQLRDLPIIVISARAGEESSVEGLAAGADDYLVKPFSARELIARVDGALALARVRREMGEALREEARSLELLNRVGAAVAAELDLGRAVQIVTEAATEMTGAAYGAFFYDAPGEGGTHTRYALAGAPRETFDDFLPQGATAPFAPGFGGVGVVRIDDVHEHPASEHPPAATGLSAKGLPIRSYLGAPVVSRSGRRLGYLMFGHPNADVFTGRAEKLLVGIAAQAAIAIDNARLFEAAQASEERQARLNQSLEMLVADRTAELEAANAELRAEAQERAKVETALRQSQKMEAVGKLTGGIAHDFNNLLQVIGGNLQLLAKDVAGSARGEQRLSNAVAGVSRGTKLASQLLAFGRRQPLAPKVVNLGRLVRALDDLLRRALGDGVEIETVVSGGLWHTLVDPSQVENALLNLAINARDAMHAHGKLTIEAGNASLGEDYAASNEDVKSGQYVMLAVSDTGSGMTPEILEHVFEPFFTTKPEGQGTGLGLSMVYGFVKQSEGHIKIYTEPGQGTTVRMYLPRVLAAEDQATEVDVGPVTGGTETVLVVEDDDEVRSTVVDLFSDLGYRVLKARDALSALTIVESGVPIDLVFTDVVMPGPLRSPDLARQARIRLPRVAVLFTSGYTENAIVHGGRLDQGIALLSKPYTREALARKVRQVLRDQQQSNDAAPPATVPASHGAAPAVAPSAVAPPPGDRASIPATLRIVFVEDDDLVRMVATDMLCHLGHEVFEAADASEALRMVGERPVDILITDLGLPGMSGDKLAAEVRRSHPQIHIIFATGADASPGNADGHPLSNAVTLLKPYGMDDLEAALQESLKRGGASQFHRIALDSPQVAT